MNRTLEGIIGDLAEFIADRVVQKLASGTISDFVDQASSPLGPRRHISAIRSGKLPGVRVGRRYLARRQDVDELVAKPPQQAGADEQRTYFNADAIDALAAQLGLGQPGTRVTASRERLGTGKGSLTRGEGMDRNTP